MIETIVNFWNTTGVAGVMKDPVMLIKYLIMYVIIGILFYLAVVKKIRAFIASADRVRNITR